MLVKVVDASAMGALVFAEPEADDVARAMSAAKLIAPSLLAYELASICLKKIAKYPKKTNELVAAFQMADRLAIEMVSVDLNEVIVLARQATLTTYDACYLWLAQETGASLITLDKKLQKAADR